MIYIRTCAYNAEKTLKKAIDSVLNQTYGEFVYYILDNGSTDATGDIIRAYAKQDKRIVPYYSEVNRNFEENPDFWNLSQHIPATDFFCILDADDYYRPTFFEEMLKFMDAYHLDIAACGTDFIDAETGEKCGGRTLKQNVILNCAPQWNANFPKVHWNLRQVWGKLYRAHAAAARFEIDLPDWWPRAYGGDTLNVMECVKAAKNFGVYAKSLHVYSLSKKSVSHKWIAGRVESDVILHEKTTEFLMQMSGSISSTNKSFLAEVYANAILDTAQVIYNCDLSSYEKVYEFTKVAVHPITQQTYRYQTVGCQNSKHQLLIGLLSICSNEEYNEKDLQRALQALLPNCGLAVTATNLPLFLAQEVQSYFLEDDREAVARTLLARFPKIRNPKKYNLGVTMQRLAINHKLLFQIDDLDFMLQFTNIYGLLWEDKYIEALDQMTGILLENKFETGKETFLNLYIDLAALQSQEKAFVFGKIQLANFYLQNNALQETRTILGELKELGLGALEDIQVLQSLLEQLEA